MLRFFGLIIAFFLFSVSFVNGQVKVRLFASQLPESAIFTVVEGEYAFEGLPNVFHKNDLVVISKYKDKLAVKPHQSQGFVVDSIILKPRTEASSFSLRINTLPAVTQFYNGDLACYHDLSTLVMINNCNLEDYIAGVVRAEGGANRPREYTKTQAIITRTYLFAHFDKHIHDRYNVCDDTHCQVFSGITSDPVINSASIETKGLVIIDKNGALISSSFHANCGGMTASSKDVWVSDLPYLRSVVDPHCANTRSSVWEKKYTLQEWTDYLKKSGYTGDISAPSTFNFPQSRRWTHYKVGSVSLTSEKMRSDLGLRSAFFSVVADNNSVTLKGRGYGHGVGLCQEGAMGMATKGNNYSEIISFYYSGVIITDLKNVKSASNTIR